MRDLVAIGLALSLAAGCSTTTTHRVPLAGNPLEQDALACVEQCRVRRPLAAYAACLDGCPGARSLVNDSCAKESAEVAVCVETSEVDDRRTALGLFAGVTTVVAVGALVFIGMLLSLAAIPFLFLAV
jgi:hypothetical protein